MASQQVSQVLSLSRNGVFDWLIQRVTAVILAVYSVVIVGYCVMQPEITFDSWRAFFGTTWMQVLTLLALLSTCAHAWIGMWTIGSDYLREHLLGSGATTQRFIYQVICMLLTTVYLVWGIRILWGN